MRVCAQCHNYKERNYVLHPIGSQSRAHLQYMGNKLTLEHSVARSQASFVPRNIMCVGPGSADGVFVAGRQIRQRVVWSKQFVLLNGKGIYLDGKRLPGSAKVGTEGHPWYIAVMDCSRGIVFNDMDGSLANNFQNNLLQVEKRKRSGTVKIEVRNAPSLDLSVTPDAASSSPSESNIAPTQDVEMPHASCAKGVDGQEVLGASSAVPTPDDEDRSDFTSIPSAVNNEAPKLKRRKHDKRRHLIV